MEKTDDEPVKVVHKWGFHKGHVFESIKITKGDKYVYSGECSRRTQYTHRCDFDPEFDCEYAKVISSAKAIAYAVGAKLEVHSDEIPEEKVMEYDQW